jgi:hypothetical protein
VVDQLKLKPLTVVLDALLTKRFVQDLDLNNLLEH